MLAVTYASVRIFQSSGMPFSVNIVNSHTAVIVPIPGIPLPKAIEPGDRVDLTTTPQATRIAISRFTQFDPAGRTYEFAIRRGRAIVTVPVTNVDTSTGTGMRWSEWAFFFVVVPFGGIALLASWRGRDRAAAGLALWAIASVVGIAASSVPLDGRLGLSVQLGVGVLYLLARVGFYMMVESMAGTALTPRSRALWRASFLLLLGAGAVAKLGGVLVFVAYGWAELLRPQYGFVFTVSYFVPVVLLFANYRHADGAQRLRLRWMLWSSVVFVTSIFLNNTPLLGFLASQITNTLLLPIAMAGFLYAVLRHRVVDVAVVLDHTLVYGGMTALVVGVLAAVNSLVEHAALGIVLGRVRTYANRIVEQVFFRRKYLAEKALRRFARHCGRYEQADQLFKASIMETRRHLGARGCAIFERKGTSYNCVYQEGEVAYPESAGIDDPAFVAARSEQKETDLSDIQSALGTDGYVFPMTALNELQGVLVCANRPGEHYAADERKLLAYVAHQVGLALYVLRMQAKLKLVDALASGTLTSLVEIQTQARSLAGAASMG
ncbi:MAG: hypothetical protein ACYDB9_12085 [Gammaproteobacteria bacterium]